MHLFHSLFTRFSGGLEQAFVNDTEALKARNHTVTALVRAEAPYLSEVQKLADTTLTFRPHGFYDIFTILKIRNKIKELRPDMLIGHNGRAITLLNYARCRLGVPLCGVSHSYKTAHCMPADKMVLLSQHMKRHFVAAGYNKPITVIPNLMHLPPEPVFKKRGSPVAIGAMGRLSPEKGFADLFQALHLLRQRGVAFTLHMGGEGPDRARLKALEAKLGLAPYIQWQGWVKDKAAFYRGLDIMCLPSHSESLPMVVMETMAYGLPLVATDADGPAIMLTHGVNALIVPMGASEAMAQALQTLIDQPELAERLAKAARREAQHYGFDKVADEWDAMLVSASEASLRQAAS